MVDISSGQFTATTGLTSLQPSVNPSALKPLNRRAEFLARRMRRSGSALSLRTAANEVATVAGDGEAVNI
jgi:hypothetical protein